jgi:RNA methyltransferase, TrmH family
MTSSGHAIRSGVKSIQSRDNSFYKELAKLSGSSRQRKKLNQTLLDGKHLLAAYLDSGYQPLHVLLNAEARDDNEISVLLERLRDVPITQLDDKLFAGLSELKTPSGILALIEIPRPEMPASQSRFVLLLEDIRDPGNLGSMLRSAAAAGCDAIFLSPGCADAWSPKVLRASMGGHFVLNIQEHANLPDIAAGFSGAKFGASLQASESLYSHAYTGNVAFAFGNEGSGLTQALVDAMNHSILIPMAGKLESLNAAAAAAVCLFEAARQRNNKN